MSITMGSTEEEGLTGVFRTNKLGFLFGDDRDEFPKEEFMALIQDFTKIDVDAELLEKALADIEAMCPNVTGLSFVETVESRLKGLEAMYEDLAKEGKTTVEEVIRQEKQDDIPSLDAPVM